MNTNTSILIVIVTSTDFDIVEEQFTPTADLLFLYPSDSSQNRSNRNGNDGLNNSRAVAAASAAGAGEYISGKTVDKENKGYGDMREAERSASQSILKSVGGLGKRLRAI